MVPQALDLYAHKLKDPAKAVAHCRAVYESAAPGAKGIYLQLLRAYLQPASGEEPKVNLLAGFGNQRNVGFGGGFSPLSETPMYTLLMASSLLMSPPYFF